MKNVLLVLACLVIASQGITFHTISKRALEPIPCDGKCIDNAEYRCTGIKPGTCAIEGYSCCSFGSYERYSASEKATMRGEGNSNVPQEPNPYGSCTLLIGNDGLFCATRANTFECTGSCYDPGNSVCADELIWEATTAKFNCRQMRTTTNHWHQNCCRGKVAKKSEVHNCAGTCFDASIMACAKAETSEIAMPSDKSICSAGGKLFSTNPACCPASGVLLPKYYICQDYCYDPAKQSCGGTSRDMASGCASVHTDYAIHDGFKCCSRAPQAKEESSDSGSDSSSSSSSEHHEEESEHEHEEDS